MKIVGIGVCGPNEKYLEATLKEFERLCDEVVIATCNATQKEIDLISKYGFWHFEDNREWGKFQPKIKTDLLRKAGKLNPDWIIALDMDEVFAPEFIRQEAERLANTEEIAYNFLIVNLYNDKDHFYHGKGIQRFWNVRYFKYLSGYTEYLNKNVHCGLAPALHYQYAWHAPYYLEHYGLMDKGDRLRKVERYAKYDKINPTKADYYEELAKDLNPIPFNREELLIKLKNLADCQPRKTPSINKMKKELKVFYIERVKNGVSWGTIPVTEDLVEETLKREKEWRLIGEVGGEPEVVEPKEEEPVANECPLCGKSFKTETALKSHKTRFHK